ncbi:MAG: response regulator containing a CheY-like receiver domain and a domain [Acidimicrobiia bacterium]|nr:response regulator containing a CheY-like receiver domain and a domain [Acidimicrobiia bacterium]
MRALIVDDSRAMRTLLRNIMRELGFEVVEAANGLEGLDRLQEDPHVDVALVDWNMPVMDGLEFVKAMRRHRQLAEIKVMMVTAENDMAKMARALMVGADEYAMKPLTRDAIIEKLELLGLSAA